MRSALAVGKTAYRRTRPGPFRKVTLACDKQRVKGISRVPENAKIAAPDLKRPGTEAETRSVVPALRGR